ncbi:unnamed protein product [Eruca vesicaria subsp. sativa]|uniref:Uncharacterized protein n=1 Tax=Eruca vesicaria subsp. sativa TaxID=29727 RepID=A0ABC8M739_ERUVS|nr:unnamed protein product [Eruca vesicaria subsp. sativa]
MNDLQGQRDEVFTDKNVSSCDLPEIVVCNCKELTHNVVKDICVDEGVPMVKEKFVLNKEETVKVNKNVSESKSLEDNNPEECVDDTKDVIELVVTEDEVGCEKSPSEDVVAESETGSTVSLTLGEIILMEGSNKLDNNVNTYETEDNLGREILEQRKSGEKKSVSWRYLPSETVESPEDRRLNNVFIGDYYDHHHLFPRNFPNEFGAESFSGSESGLGYITYSAHISISRSFSARSDGSTVSGQSFAFPVLQQEWNSTPARMVRAQKRQLQKEKGWKHYSRLCCRFCRS